MGNVMQGTWLEIPLLNGYLVQVNRSADRIRHSAQGDVTGDFWFPGAGPTPAKHG